MDMVIKQGCYVLYEYCRNLHRLLYKRKLSLVLKQKILLICVAIPGLVAWAPYPYPGCVTDCQKVTNDTALVPTPPG